MVWEYTQLENWIYIPKKTFFVPMLALTSNRFRNVFRVSFDHGTCSFIETNAWDVHFYLQLAAKNIVVSLSFWQLCCIYYRLLLYCSDAISINVAIGFKSIVVAAWANEKGKNDFPYWLNEYVGIKTLNGKGNGKNESNKNRDVEVLICLCMKKSLYWIKYSIVPDLQTFLSGIFFRSSFLPPIHWSLDICETGIHLSQCIDWLVFTTTSNFISFVYFQSVQVPVW